MDRRGAVAVLSAALMAALVGFAGLAVDTTRLWLVEARLKTAIDAAALVAARRMDAPTRDAEAQSVFWSHFTQNGTGRAYMGASISNPVITPDANDSTRIRVDATATVPTTLFSVISQQTIPRSEHAVAQRSGTGLELAIVLDQTSSMRESAGGGSGTKLDAAKAAVGSLLDILYGNQDTQPNLWVSVVPFSRTINIGTANSGFLDTSSMPAGWNLAAWSGCVEARQNGNDMTDIAPAGAGRFRPYFWPSTYRQVGTVGSGRCQSGNAYPGSNSNSQYCHGDNDWGHSGNGGGPSQSNLNANYMYSYLRGEGLSHSQSVGPNLLCALTPIQPLTASRTTVETAVDAIQAPAKSGGTTTPVGLQGAWYTLSPAWQGYWQDPNAGVPNTPNLPLPYNTRNMKKVVVMLTDGDNNWQPAYGDGCGSTRDGVCSSASGTELLYNAYGRVTDWNTRFPTNRISPVNQTNADARLDDRFTTICNAMKAAGKDILIYIIGFEVSTANRARLRSCATSAQHYFESPTTSQLQSVFTQVANQLASLRLAE